MEFTKSKSTSTGLREYGYMYMPYACMSGGCNLHVTLHGCNYDRDDPTDWYKDKTNFINYAATNNLIILYPTADECWDVRNRPNVDKKSNSTKGGP